MGNSILRRGVALAIIGLASVYASSAPLEGQGGFRFRTGVDLINVTATVTDASGRFAPGLTQNDFMVYEDDRPVEVTHFSAERVPVSVGILLDTSGSMQGEKIQNALSAIERFLHLLGPDDDLFISGFSNDVDLIQGWTTNREVAIASLQRVQAEGGTAMYDAVVEAVPMAQDGRNRKKAIVLISDGNDSHSQTGLQDVRLVVRQSDVLVYAIGIDGQSEPGFGGRPQTLPPAPSTPRPRSAIADDRLNDAALREITDDSGGRTEIVRGARDLDPATSSIANELSKQYYLGYTSSRHKDGRWHTIRVEVRQPSLRVRARSGYLSS